MRYVARSLGPVGFWTFGPLMALVAAATVEQNLPAALDGGLMALLTAVGVVVVSVVGFMLWLGSVAEAALEARSAASSDLHSVTVPLPPALWHRRRLTALLATPTLALSFAFVLGAWFQVYWALVPAALVALAAGAAFLGLASAARRRTLRAAPGGLEIQGGRRLRRTPWMDVRRLRVLDQQLVLESDDGRVVLGWAAPGHHDLLDAAARYVDAEGEPASVDPELESLRGAAGPSRRAREGAE